jgi:hypothetical protein
MVSRAANARPQGALSSLESGAVPRTEGNAFVIQVVPWSTIPIFTSLGPAALEVTQHPALQGLSSSVWTSVYRWNRDVLAVEDDGTSSIDNCGAHAGLTNSLRAFNIDSQSCRVVIPQQDSGMAPSGVCPTLRYSSAYNNSPIFILPNGKFFWSAGGPSIADLPTVDTTHQWEMGIAPLVQDGTAYIKNAEAAGIAGSGRRYNPAVPEFFATPVLEGKGVQQTSGGGFTMGTSAANITWRKLQFL